MSPIFWLDVAALGISIVVATSLALIALEPGPSRVLDWSFALFALMGTTWAGFSLLLRLALWLEKGDPLLLSELATLALALMGPLLLMFAIRYVGHQSRWVDLAAALGLVTIAALSIPLFHHLLIFNPQLAANGSTTMKLNSWGLVIAAIPTLFFAWSLALLWQEHRQTGGSYLALSTLILLVGFVGDGLLKVPFPVLSVTNTLSMTILGYGIISQQTFNPLKKQTADLRREIAERRQVEEALRKSEERFRTIVDGINDALFIHDADSGAILNVNTKMSEMYGYTQHEAQQLDVEALSLGVKPYTQQEAMAWMKKAQEEGPQLFEWQAKDKQGRLFWVEVNMRRTKIGGQDRLLVAVRDISDRKRIEEDLAKERSLLHTLINNVPVHVYVKDDQSRFVTANEAVAQLVGASSPDELIGKTDFDFYPDEQAKEFYIDEQTIVQTGKPLINKDELNRDHQGNQRWLLTSKVPLQDRTGNIVGIVGLGHDITERKRAEEALQESQKNLQILFNSLQDFLFVLDLEGRILHVNPLVLERLGYSEKELLGHPILKVHPSDRHDEARAIVADMLAGKTDTCSIPLQDKRGTLIPVDTRVTKGHWSGQPVLFGISRDITERKRAEAEREQLLSALMHRSTQLVTAAEVSKSASTILEPKELIRETVNLIQQRFDFYYVGLFLVDKTGERAVLHAGTGKAGLKMLAAGHWLAVGGKSMVGQCIAHAQARIALDVGEESTRFDNPHLPLTRSEMALPLVSRGQCIGALTVQSVKESAFTVDDVATLQVMADQLAIAITNARLYDQVQRHATHLEERVAGRTAELAAISQELRTFSYSVSHDLRAPLRSIDGFSQALLEDHADQLDATGQDYLQRMRAASQRMGQLIDDLLQLSRVTQRQMCRETVDLSTLASTITSHLKETHPERQVDFVITEGVTADGDPRLLQIALENLLGNAWKFTARHPQARIEFGVTSSQGEQVYFVRDDGAGFDMDYVDKLFRAFQRLHGMTEFEGTGIGLATVKRIVHRHGGQVWAEGTVEQGATFYFTLVTRKGEKE